MAGFAECMEAVGDVLGRRLSMDEAEALWSDLAREQQRLRSANLADDPLTAARSLAAQRQIEKAIAHRNAVKNVLGRQNINNRIALAEAAGLDASDALHAMKVGIVRPFEGGRESVAAKSQAILNDKLGAAQQAAAEYKARTGVDLITYANDPANRLEVARAARGEAASADAREWQRIKTLVDDDLIGRENRAGSWRGKIDGYVTAQTHNPDAVRKAGPEEWTRFTMERIDPEKTFVRDEDRAIELRQEIRGIEDQTNAAVLDLASQKGALTGQRRRARQAEGRLETAETRLTEAETRAEEAARSAGEAVGRYWDQAERERAARAAGEGVMQSAAQRREARVAATRELARLRELRERELAARSKAGIAAEAADDATSILDAAIESIERGEKAIDLMADLETRLGELQRRVRGEITDPQAFMQRTFNRITTDTWMRNREGPGFEGVAQFIGPVNLARRRSERHRELHFKDAQAEVEYAERFGHGGYLENVVKQWGYSARAIAMMEEFGPNAKANHDAILLERLAKASDEGDRELATKLQRAHHENEWKVIDGTTQSVVNPTLAHVADAHRASMGIAKLGFAMLSSFSDTVTTASTLKYAGVGFLDRFGATVAAVPKFLTRPADEAALLNRMAAGSELLNGRIHATWQVNDSKLGRVSRMASWFHKWNLLGGWTDAHKQAAALLTSHHFAENAGHAFGALGESEQRLLSMYGIKKDAWELMRQHGVETGPDGRRYIMPDRIDAMPLGHFYDLSTERANFPIPPEGDLRAARDRLATQWRTLIVDEGNFAVPTPTAREQALMTAGHPRGTVMGEGWRYLTQFKGFGVSMVTKNMARQVYGHGGNSFFTSGGMVRLGWMAAQLTAMGYMSMVAKDLVKGKEPRPPDDPRTWMAAFVQGGGAGLLGDLLWGEHTRFGQSAIMSLLGPGVSQADDAAKIVSRLVRGDAFTSDTGLSALERDASRFVVGNTPLVNLFYLRPALDWLVLYPLWESLSPGYTERMNDRIQRDEGRGFWLDPRQAVR